MHSVYLFFWLKSKNDKVRKSIKSMASLKQCLPINSLYCNPICNYITSFILATRWQEHANSITGFSLCLSTVHSVKEMHLAETQDRVKFTVTYFWRGCEEYVGWWKYSKCQLAIARNEKIPIVWLKMVCTGPPYPLEVYKHDTKQDKPF